MYNTPALEQAQEGSLPRLAQRVGDEQNAISDQFAHRVDPSANRTVRFTASRRS
jgi:hypothetical protein